MIKRKLHIEGELVEVLGGNTELEIAAASPSDVFRCLECNFPRFREYLLECHEKGVQFLCSLAGEFLDEKELLMNYGEGDMVLTPVPAGSKSGIAKLLAAIVIIYVAVVTGGAAVKAAFAAGELTFAAAATMTAISFGINLALAGIQQLMAPDPASENAQQQDSSYLFQGTGQTVVEGEPVPVLYGQLRVPGRPVSFQVQNIANTISNYSGNGGGGGGNGQGDQSHRDGEGNELRVHR